MTRRRHWIWRVLWLCLGLLASAALAAYLTLRGSLPRYQGRQPLPGLAATAQVERDALGTVTVTAANRTDAMRALGFVHAQERFFEMDLMRRAAAGELSELIGAATLPIDRRNRAHRFRARAHAFAARLRADQRRDAQAYVDGVNSGLRALTVRPFPYLLLQQAPQPWRIEDIALVIDAMFLDLNDSSNVRELARGKMKAVAHPALYALLEAGGTAWDAPLQGERSPDPPLPTADQVDLRRYERRWFGAPMPQDEELTRGSNNFAVDGSLSDSRAALVANDMHLKLRVPNIWFRARLRYAAPDDQARDVSGVSLPGVPGIVAGSNRHVAWGFTNSFGDWLDWVEVRWLDGARTRYRTAQGEATVTVHDEPIRVRGAPMQMLRVRETQWGPVLHDGPGPTGLALNWTAHHPEATNLNLTELEAATNVDEAVAIAHRSGMPPQNFVVGDRQGRIAWTLIGAIPLREGFDPGYPATFDRPGVGWSGWAAPDRYPVIRDPSTHRLWTANARVAAGADLALLGDGGYNVGARAWMIRERLFARARFAPQDLLDIQLDDRSLFLQRWHRLLRQVLLRPDAPARYAELERATRSWDERAQPSAVSYRLTRAFRLAVSGLVLDGLCGPIRAHDPNFQVPNLPQSEEVVWRLVQERPAHLLAPLYPNWDELLHAALDQVLERYAGSPDGLARRTWGERNTSAIAHPLAQAMPFLGRWLNMPAHALPGDSTTPRMQSPTQGASERFAVSPGHEEQGIFHMPGGQSGHPLSPYYGAGHEDWEHGRPTPFLPGPSVQKLILLPAS